MIMTKSKLPLLEQVHFATTREELDAIYRFRYNIFATELGREIGGIDHETRTMRDEDDEKDFAIHLYVGEPDQILGSLRLCVWDPGCIPEGHYKTLSLELFPGIDKLPIAEGGRLWINRDMRGRMVLPSLMQESYKMLAGQKKVDLLFGYCRPGLVHHYRKLGSRPYVGRLVSSPEGMLVPMLTVLSDKAYFEKVGSPAAQLVDKYFGHGKIDPVDPSQYENVFDNDLHPVDTNPEKVWEKLQDVFVHEQSKGRVAFFLESLPRHTLKELSNKGFIITIPSGSLVTKKGHVEKEMYFILDGTFEVFSDQRVIRIMDKGDLFGEVAFFRESGRRSASVRAISDGRLLVLRRHLMQELSKEDPETAYIILFNLGRILSERLASPFEQI
jgi:Cyclic nucleotide-binding domain/Acetyltransferase (GNAT) domain